MWSPARSTCQDLSLIVKGVRGNMQLSGIQCMVCGEFLQQMPQTRLLDVTSGNAMVAVLTPRVCQPFERETYISNGHGSKQQLSFDWYGGFQVSTGTNG